MQPEFRDGNGTSVAISRGAPQAQQQPKALRFVTNYGAPHPKRRRIGAACMTCRKRKTACSGEKPFCDTCKQNKLECAGYAAETSAIPEASRKKQRREDANNARKASNDERDAGSASPERSDRPVVATKRASASEHVFQSQAENQSQAPTDADGQMSRPEPSSRGRAQAEKRSNGSPTGDRQESLLSNDSKRNRMPYFRWLGPTAIMPGFKQMVVKVKPKDPTDVQSTSSGGVRSPSHFKDGFDSRVFDTSPATASSIDIRTPVALPFYDTSPMPPSELITHLVGTFFTHLGCNYPFLQRQRFMRDLEDKRVDALLVDSVCALAARFSNHPLLIQAARAGDGETGLGPAEYGRVFAQRAKVALIDRFHCPSVAAAQAALLLAYNEFGEQKDSGLWMYLGIAIRLAQDLGMHKGEGLKFVGNEGPTPKKSKRASFGEEEVRETVRHRAPAESTHVKQENGAQDHESGDGGSGPSIEEQRANEQEYVDTFWAIFFLDRVVSSGTGRRSTLRDKDIEVCFPAASTLLPPARSAPSVHTPAATEWPAPFPALIRIVHLYGRVADLLNSIKEPGDITPELPSTLAAMENNVTNFYQALSPRLHFDAVNFQHYMKAGEGTNFVLLHFWFHTLIILLHQPTLLKTFNDGVNGGVSDRLQLFPNSSKLAMSSAKTIADILSYSQLMDAKASLGNPFTTQPIYIAAKVFLKEVKEQTAGSSAASGVASRVPSPDRTGTKDRAEGQAASKAAPKTGAASVMNRPSASNSTKHALLATAASQHYQLCYKALQSLETYWAGTKYILTVLEQQFAGNLDPLLYTEEEEESAMERPRPEPGFEKPAWRGRRWSTMSILHLLNGGSGDQPSVRGPGQTGAGAMQNAEEMSMGGIRFGGAEMSWLQNFGQSMPMYFPGLPGSPMPGGTGADGGQAIGWTMTGTMNSPSTNLAWHYTSGNANSPANVSGDAHNVSGGASNDAFDQFAGYVGSKSSLPHGRDFPPGSASSGQHSQSQELTRSASHDLGAGYAPQAPQHHRSFSTNALPAYAMGASGGPNVVSYASPSMRNTALASSANAHNMSPSASTNLPGVPAGLHVQGAGSGPTLGPGTPSLLFPQTPGDTMMIESQDVDMSLLGLDMMPWFETFPTHDLDAFSAMASGTPIAPAGPTPTEESRAISSMQRSSEDAGKDGASPR